MDLIRAGPNPILEDYYSFLRAAHTDDRPTIADILVMWYRLLGGHVEEGTFWAADKSYAVVSLFLFPEYLALRTQRFVGNHPLQLASNGDGCYRRWKPFQSSQVSHGLFGGVEGVPTLDLMEDIGDVTLKLISSDHQLSRCSRTYVFIRRGLVSSLERFVTGHEREDYLWSPNSHRMFPFIFPPCPSPF